VLRVSGAKPRALRFRILSSVIIQIGVVAQAATTCERRIVRIWNRIGRRAERTIGVERTVALDFCRVIAVTGRSILLLLVV
jgi:hypothetical protein